MVPEDTHGFGPLLRLQKGVLQGDGRVQGGWKRRAFAMHGGTHNGRVDDRPVGKPGTHHEQEKNHGQRAH